MLSRDKEIDSKINRKENYLSKCPPAIETASRLSGIGTKSRKEGGHMPGSGRKRGQTGG